MDYFNSRGRELINEFLGDTPELLQAYLISNANFYEVKAKERVIEVVEVKEAPKTKQRERISY